METLHSFVKASRMPPPGGGARMTDMLVVGQMMEYFERHPDKNAVATGELGRRLGFTKPMLTHILDRLEQNGVILRTQSQTDRRVTLLSFSESGVQSFMKNRELTLARIRRIIERFGYWKDSGIRLEGEGVWGLTAAFLNMWSFLGGELHEERDYYRPHTSPATDGFCQPFLDGPQNNPDNPAEDTFLQLIGSARRFLYITTPYFIPDENIMRALCIAGDGGVDVRLMLPGTPDHWYADAVADSYIGELLEHHVKVYRYTPGFLHAKSIMVDRETAFVGSVNFDYRSFELHYECGVMLYGASAIESLLEDMDGILDKSHAVTPEEWARRGLLRQMFEPILRIFSIWM